MIQYGRQSIDQNDIDAVTTVLKSALITQGPVAREFENEVIAYTGASYGVACINGTAALHISCLALGLGKGDLAWTVANTYIASANSILYCGADIDFVDIDPLTFNMSVPDLERKLIEAEALGRLPKIVIIVHFAGESCDMKAIAVLAQKYGFYIIEDSAHALGASYDNTKVGGCKWSDISTFSFHPVKSITTGEGGMLTTNHQRVADIAKLLVNQGVTRCPKSMTRSSDGPWYYEQIALGFNYRMTDFQAALGVSQLKRIDLFIGERQKIAEFYEASLDRLELSYQQIDKYNESSRHLFVALLPESYRVVKKDFFDSMEKQGIKLNCHYIPVPLQPFYQRLGFNPNDFPNAMNYYSKTFSLPIYPGLKKTEMNLVVSAIESSIS